MSTRVGFIGLGAIGRPMARYVAKKFETTVWNRSAAKADAFAKETGARAAKTLQGAIDLADVVVTCLPTSREVRDVVERDGLGWHAGQMLIDATSGDPFNSRELAAWLAKRGVGFVDAPVSGGTSGAEAGTLTVMMGGEAKWVERAREVVSAFSGKVVHVGPVGTGHALKAINNMLLAVNIQAAGEGLAALVKLGVSATTALDVINASSGRSNVTENLIPQRVVTRAWPRTFRLALLNKDVGIALDVLKQTGTPADVTSVVKRCLADDLDILGDQADHVEAIKEIERRAGVEIK